MSEARATAGATGFTADPRLPQRDLLLDEEAMATVLRSSLDRDVESCIRVRTKYRVGESLRVSYDVSTGSETVRVSLRCFPERSRPAMVDSGRPAFHLPRLNAIGWIFPDDRKLPALHDFWTNTDRRRRALSAEVDQLDLVSYAPEKAATIRCRARGSTIGYAKLYAKGADLAALAKYRTLGPAMAAGGIAAPHPMTTDRELGLVFLSPVTGELLSASTSPHHWRALGEATAKLHAIPPAEELPVFERATLPRLQSVGALISTARPDVGPRVACLLEHLQRQAPKIAMGQPDATLHGDLHGKNALVTGGRLGFIDLDQAARGPAVAELGSVIAALRYAEGGSNSRTRAFESCFLDGYTRRSGTPSVAALSWHIAAALLGERALRAVNRVRINGLTRLPEIIQSAIDTLEGADR